jgi:serine/threonine protein kinase
MTEETKKNRVIVCRSPSDESGVTRSYELIERIGEGGHADVFMAQLVDADAQPKKVAVKYLKEKLIETQAREMNKRFAREVNIARSLSNPYLVQVLDVGQDVDGRDFYVMEFVEGGWTLFDEVEERFQSFHNRGVRRNPVTKKIQTSLFTGSEIVQLVLQLLEAIGAIHGIGVIHRDLKTTNVLITKRDGEMHLLLSDYGIAKCFDEEAAAVFGGTATQEGKAIGTPYYMAPEQFIHTSQTLPDGSRKAWKVNPRSDFWALGIIIYELVTGRTPFTGDSLPELTGNIVDENVPIPPFSDHVTLPDPRFEAFVHCLLKKKAWERPGSIEEVKRLFREMVVDAPESKVFTSKTVETDHPVLQIVEETMQDQDGERKGQDNRSTTQQTRLEKRNSAFMLVLAIVAVFGLAAASWIVSSQHRANVQAAKPTTSPGSVAAQPATNVSPATHALPSVVALTSKWKRGNGPPKGSEGAGQYKLGLAYVAAGNCALGERYLLLTRITYPDFPDPLPPLAECARNRNRKADACDRYLTYLKYEGVSPLVPTAQAFVNASCKKP